MTSGLKRSIMWSMMPYERLDAWRLSHQLALDVYAATERWARSERYELTSQVRRAALSVPANIAEGSGRYGPREQRRFLNIAFASLTELSYLLCFARDRGHLTSKEWEELESLRTRVAKTSWGLLKAVMERRSSHPRQDL